MGLETGTYISDLVPTNPVGATDPKSQGDDHLRLIKSVLKNTFPSITGAVTKTQTELNDVARLSIDNTFTADEIIKSALPRLHFWNTGAATDAKRWAWRTNTDGSAEFDIMSDAGIAQSSLIVGTRSGLSGTGLQLGPSLSLSVITLAGVAASDFARLSINNTFAGGVQKVLTTGNPMWAIGKSDAGTNNKHWLDYLTATGRIFAVATDASPTTDAGAWMVVARSGTTITNLDLTATSITLNGVVVSDFARLSQSNTFTGATQAINNATNGAGFTVSGGGANGSFFSLTTPGIGVGSTSNHSFGIYSNNTERINISNGGNFDFKGGSVTTNNAAANEVGYKGLPQNSQNIDYTAVLGDANKTLHQTGATKTFTIPANSSVAFPIGTTIVFTCDNATGVSIAITSDTLRLAGTATTGTRTLAQYGVATAVKILSTTWLISGAGLS